MIHHRYVIIKKRSQRKTPETIDCVDVKRPLNVLFTRDILSSFLIYIAFTQVSTNYCLYIVTISYFLAQVNVTFVQVVIYIILGRFQVGIYMYIVLDHVFYMITLVAFKMPSRPHTNQSDPSDTIYLVARSDTIYLVALPTLGAYLHVNNSL